MMKIICVIPARYGSTRLPGKPLADIAGKPMIQRVYEQVQKATEIDDVVVATDDERVFQVVEGFGGSVLMTSANHLTGTDRLAEVAQVRTDVDVIINVQGDEPLIDPDLVNQLAQLFKSEPTTVMATVACPLLEEEYDEPSCVKVVKNLQGQAMYFSRSLVPYNRNAFVNPPAKHVGIYAYSREFLLKYATMAPTPLELTESLEQLRVLENGYPIKIIETDRRFLGVDTPEDLKAVSDHFRRLEHKEK